MVISELIILSHSVHWQELVAEVDPDIIIGYNICKFDLPYLIEVKIGNHVLLILPLHGYGSPRFMFQGE